MSGKSTSKSGVDAALNSRPTDNPINIATGRPPMEDPWVRKYNDNKRKETNTNLQGSSDKATGNVDKYTQERYDTDPTKLNKWQNANYAKGQGQYGMFNNKDYGTTLKLAREVDAYNAAPREHHKVIGLNNQIQDLGVQYDKPKLETMESRAIQQSIDLDTNQKRLAQGLQDEVNHKDLEAFKDMYKEKFGINLKELDAEHEYTKWLRQQEVMQLMKKDIKVWTDLWNLHMRTAMIQKAWNMSKTNPIMAQLFGEVMGISTIPTLDDHAAAVAYAQFINSNPPPTADEIREFGTAFEGTYGARAKQQADEIAGMYSQVNGPFDSHSATSSGKAMGRYMRQSTGE